MSVQKILIVRLPCKKVFPTGPVYLLSLIKRTAPETRMGLLDLALVQNRDHLRVLDEAVREQRPDLIAFSWRDIQIFSPQDMDSAMRDAFVFFYDPSPIRKAGAAFRDLAHIFSYRSSIAHNFSLIRRAAVSFPSPGIALGGSGVRIFHQWLSRKIPPRVKVFPEADLGAFFDLLGVTAPEDSVEPGIDLETLENAFPQWRAYAREPVGIQTKRGCPQGCLFCLYGFLEGKTVARRSPDFVVREIKAYSDRWGARRFWFADAQLLSEPPDRPHLAEILGGILRARLDIEWSGYLRISEIDRELASLMTRSGLQELEVSLSSGSQTVVDRLRLGFTVEDTVRGCGALKEAGYEGRILLNLSLNAPGETRETLRETMAAVRRIEGIFGRARVVPVVFFLAIQPHTGLEREAIGDGYLRAGYNPLSVSPAAVRKLIYNPPPLDRMIGRAVTKAFAAETEGAGAGILSLLEGELERSRG
jgi:hypothetical protein